MKLNDRLDSLRIASPCPANWEQMKGDDRTRSCELCELRVYNISKLTRAEINALIAKTEQRVCARLYRRSDGTVITRDCPVGLLAIRRRVARIAATSFAALVSLSSVVLGQRPDKKDSCQAQVKISRSVQNTNRATIISGTVFDPNGAVIPGARISLADETGKQILQMTSRDNGTFQFVALAAGTYNLQIEGQGFLKAVVKDVRLGVKETVNLEITMLVDGKYVTVGILMADPDLLDRDDATIKMVLSGETIRKLPIH